MADLKVRLDDGSETHAPMELVAPLPPELAALMTDTPKDPQTSDLKGPTNHANPGRAGNVAGRRGGSGAESLAAPAAVWAQV